MKYSLLYKFAEQNSGIASIYDLSLDRTFERISGKNKRTDYFLKTLETPLTDVRNIEYRRGIIKDFLNNNSLIDLLRTVFSRYDKIKADWLEMKGGSTSAAIGVSGDVMLEQIYSSLKVTAMFPNTLCSLFKSIFDILSNADITSEGLCSVRDYCKNMLESEEFQSLLDISSDFLYGTAGEHSYEAVCAFDENLSLKLCSLSSASEYKKKKKILGFGGKKTDEKHPAGLNEIESDEARRLLCASFSRLDSLLETITDKVYASLYGISFELDFYFAALSYISFAESKNCNLTYPDLSNEPTLKAVGLSDLFLLTDSGTERVYPYDIKISAPHDSMVVTGGNGSGKTTFLRAVGSMQLLAQAGLPVTAKEASLSITTGIYTHFSSEEEKFAEGDRAGRFESEVRAVSAILDSLGKGSLVLLNETFQTTAYDEGSAAIVNILKAINKLGGGYIFVTHLPGVVSSLPENVLKMRTGKSFGELICER